MIIIKTLNDFFETRRLIKSVRRLTQITISNQEMREIKIKKVMFLYPGRFSLVYRDKFHNTQMKRFLIKEPIDLSIQELFKIALNTNK